MLRLIKDYSSLLLAFLCLGCGEAKKTETPEVKSNNQTFLDRLERKRTNRVQTPPVVKAPIPKVETVTPVEPVPVAPVPAVAANSASTTTDLFRQKLEAITGKTIDSDAALLAKAESGDREAQAELGKKAFQSGNMTDGLKWAQKAADQGDAGSAYGLAVCYTKGYGVEANAETAVKFFSIAANQGHIDAQASLGKRYSLGEGVTQDKIEAYKWYDIAFKLGRVRGDVSRDKIAATMTQPELAEAMRRSANFVVQKPR